MSLTITSPEVECPIGKVRAEPGIHDVRTEFEVLDFNTDRPVERIEVVVVVAVAENSVAPEDEDLVHLVGVWLGFRVDDFAGS